MQLRWVEKAGQNKLGIAEDLIGYHEEHLRELRNPVLSSMII